MKMLKKINKGLVLTVIVLFILVIYLINVEITRKKEKPEIERLCKEYVNMIDRYFVMPEKASNLYTHEERQEKANEIKGNIEKALAERKTGIEADLKKFMINNDKAIQIQKNVIEDLIDTQKDAANEIVTSYDREITKIKKYKFDGEQVIVTFDTNTTYEKKYLSLDDNTLEYKEETKKETLNGFDESITLKKEDGKWKVAYASLSYENLNDKYVSDTTQMVIY